MNRLTIAAFVLTGVTGVATALVFKTWLLDEKPKVVKSIDRKSIADETLNTNSMTRDERARLLSRLAANSAPQDRPPPATLAANSPRSGEVAGGLEQRLAEQRQNEQRYAQKLDKMLADQGRDLKWAGDTERAIEQVLTGMKTSASLEETRCGADLCRVVVKAGDEENKRKLTRAVGKEAPFASGTYFSYAGTTITMYVVREGRALPDMDP